MTLATYQGVTWRVTARYWAPIPYVELETPSGGRCAVPASRIEILPERPKGYTLADVLAMRARFAEMADVWSGTTELERKYTGPEIREGDRVGYQGIGEPVRYGIVSSHVETAPGVWTTTLEEGQS